MPRPERSLDVRAEHPKRVHVDCQVKEIGMKKAARDQLPQLESDGSVKLTNNKMPDRPERESGEQSRAGYRFKDENGHVYADQYSSEPRHKKPSHEGRKGSPRTQCYGDLSCYKTDLPRRERKDFLDF